MFKLRSRITVSQPDDDTIVVQSSVGRRVLFGAIALLLLVAFVMGVDWESDFADGMVAGTVFFFSITAICIAVAGWNSMVVLNRSRGSAEFIRKLFGIRLGFSSLELALVTAVVVRGLRFLRESELPQQGFLGPRTRGLAGRRNVYYKLHLETAERLYFVEDSTELTELESAGQGIADFLGVAYRQEDL